MYIAPSPLSKQQRDKLIGHRINYVIIYGAESIFFKDTIHAFTVDSCCSYRVNVLGTRIEWLSADGKGVKRALFMDETGFIKEMAFDEPVPIHIAQILHLPLKREQQMHRELSDHFQKRDIPQINPYETSKRADNKAWTHKLWAQYDQKIISPRYVLIQQESPENIFESLQSFVKETGKVDIVVQPNKGTEGRKVERFSMENGLRTDLLPVLEYIREQVLPEDDAIVREKRGNAGYSKHYLNIAFRINVAWNGLEFVAESGYAQVAKDETTFPASRGRGGQIIDINEALADLYYPKLWKSLSKFNGTFPKFHRDKTWVRLIPTGEDIARMKDAAVSAVYALNAGLNVRDYIKLIGIDILLEVDGNADSINPVVLEANPRPAGLNHSSEIVGISSKKPQTRISTGIFKSILFL